MPKNLTNIPSKIVQFERLTETEAMHTGTSLVGPALFIGPAAGLTAANVMLTHHFKAAFVS